MAVIAIPISLQSMITIGVNMTDTVMVGKLGETSLSATALANQFVNIYQICCMGIAMGASVLTSRFWGMQDITSLKKTITLILGLVVGILGGGLIKVLSRPIIGLYNITPETAQIAGELMDAIAFIVIFQSMNSILTKGVLRGGGDTKFLMVADIIFLWAASLPLGILAGLVWHLDAFWIYVFLKIDQICKSIWCVFRLRSGKWIKTFSKEKMNHAQ